MEKKKVLKVLGLHLTIFLVLVVYVFVLGVGCLFRNITGIPCPSCGMTRALNCLFKFNFAGAFHFHPFFMFPPLIIVLLAHIRLIKKKTNKMYIFVCFFICLMLVALIGLYIYRMVNNTIY